MEAVLRLAGIDPNQWRALTATFLRMDLRKAGVGMRKGAATGTAVAHGTLVVGAGLNSIMIAMFTVLLDDPFTAAFMAMSFVALNVALLVVIDFSGSVVSPVDYWVIAPRPVSARTYFGARIAAVLAYVTLMAGIMSFLPAVVFLLRHKLGVGGFVGAIAAGILCATASSCLVISLYTWAIARVSPRRVMHALSWAQLLGSSLSMAGFFGITKAFSDPSIRSFTLDDYPVIRQLPAAWYASIVTALSGTGESGAWIAAVAGVSTSIGLVWLAAGQFSLELASKLSEVSGAAAAATRPARPLPGFREGEMYAVATLVRAQFRHDTRFRLGVLSIIPLTMFYLVLGWDRGAVADPFTHSFESSATAVYMAVAFLPMVLHGALQSSDQWRASWIFFATPADAGRLVVASKNFVSVFFLGTYLLLLGVFWSFFFDRAWHAFVHALFVGAGAHMLLQGAILVSPSLPFSREPHRGEQSARFMGLFFIGSIGAQVGPRLLTVAYRRPLWTVVVAVVLVAATAVLERALRARARKMVNVG